MPVIQEDLFITSLTSALEGVSVNDNQPVNVAGDNNPNYGAAPEA
jgi:hypothetical protein